MRRLWCKIRTGQSTKLSSYVINYSNSFGVCIHLPCELPTLHIYSWKIYRRSSLRDSAKFPLIAIVVGIVQNTSVNTQMSSGNIFCNIHHIFFSAYLKLFCILNLMLLCPQIMLWFFGDEQKCGWFRRVRMENCYTNGIYLCIWNMVIKMKNSI